MSTTLITTVGGSDSNSYPTLEEAEAHVATFRYLPGMGITTTAWDAAETEAKKLALVMGTAAIDTLPFNGVPVSDTQALMLPMNFNTSTAFNGTVPSVAKQAVAAMACFLLLPVDEQAAMRNAGIQSATMGKQSITFRGSGNAPTVPLQVSKILENSGLVARSSGGSTYLPRG